MKFMIVVATALLLGGCQAMSQQPLERQIEFPSEEYANLEMEGDSEIKGQLFLRTQGGDVKYGAGQEVIATPVTSYTTETTKAIQSGRRIEDPDPRAQQYTRRVQADGEGRFSITGLPAGEYYVAGSVFWESPARYAPTQGGVVIKKVTLNKSEVESVMLTR